MKFIRSFVFVLLAFATLLSSRPSQAAIGAIAVSPAVVTAGLIIAGGGVVSGAVALVTPCRGDACMANGFFILLISIPATLLGLLVLDEEQSISYAPLNFEEARKLKLTSAELASYNAEIDEINALAAFVDSETARLQTEDPKVVAGIWTEVKEAISPEAFSAVVKVTQPLHNR